MHLRRAGDAWDAPRVGMSILLPEAYGSGEDRPGCVWMSLLTSMLPTGQRGHFSCLIGRRASLNEALRRAGMRQDEP